MRIAIVEWPTAWTLHLEVFDCYYSMIRLSSVFQVFPLSPITVKYSDLSFLCLSFLFYLYCVYAYVCVCAFSYLSSSFSVKNKRDRINRVSPHFMHGPFGARNKIQTFDVPSLSLSFSLDFPLLESDFFQL